MRTPPDVRLERFRKLIERISLESENGSVIVVEGPKDREALQRLGIPGTILCLQNSRMNPARFSEQLDDTLSVVVLTDFDRQGVFLAKSLARVLNSQHIRTNLLLWRDLRRLTKSHIRSIEELPKLHQRLENEVHPTRQFPT